MIWESLPSGCHSATFLPHSMSFFCLSFPQWSICHLFLKHFLWVVPTQCLQTLREMPSDPIFTSWPYSKSQVLSRPSMLYYCFFSPFHFLYLISRLTLKFARQMELSVYIRIWVIGCATQEYVWRCGADSIGLEHNEVMDGDSQWYSHPFPSLWCPGIKLSKSL